MPYVKPLPITTPENQPFWDGLKRHEFLVPKCRDCGDYNWTPYPACRSCLSTNQEWTKVSGEGTVYTYTVVHRGIPGFDVPYVIVVAELKEQPRPILVMSNLINCNPDDVKTGMPVKVAYEDIPEENITMWRFEPV